MKKLFSILFVLLLSLSLIGCSKKISYPASFYKTVGSDYIKKMDENKPLSVEVMIPSLGMGIEVSEEDERYQEIIDAFKQIEIVGEAKDVEPEAFEESNLRLNICFEEGSYETFDFYGCLYQAYIDEKVVNYELQNYEALFEKANSYISEQSHGERETIDLFEHEGIKVQMGQHYLTEDGDYSVELLFDNTTEKSIGVSIVDAYANGFRLGSTTSYIVPGNTTIGYYDNFYTRCLKEYGINHIGEINFKLQLSTINPDNYEMEDVIYTSDSFTIKTDEYDKMDKELSLSSLVYEDNETSIYGKLIDPEEHYSYILFAIQNKADKEVSVDFGECDMNDMVEDYSGYYGFSIDPNGYAFQIVPLMNYTYDQENEKIYYFDILSLLMEVKVNEKAKRAVLR